LSFDNGDTWITALTPKILEGPIEIPYHETCKIIILSSTISIFVHGDYTHVPPKIIIKLDMKFEFSNVKGWWYDRFRQEHHFDIQNESEFLFINF
jgi:hypothetical protein